MSENPQKLLSCYPDQESRLVIGMISGTSADGVDVVKVRFPPAGQDRPLELVSFQTVPYPPELKNEVLEAAADRVTLRQAAVLNIKVGEFFASAALDAIGDDRCCLVASHGQTVCHLPEARTTLQLGEGALIANRTGVLTVSDFRTADMALGGQGAPLVPLFDGFLLASPETVRVAVNLGGIANITVIGKGGSPITAWDTGPANCVSDSLCRIHGQGDFDPGGSLAARGHVDQELLQKLLTHPYFGKTPPKSTGLEDFGRHFAEEFPTTLRLPDALRTALALSAQTLVDEIVRSVGEEEAEVVFAGGGTSNATLMEEIEHRLAQAARASGRAPVSTRRFSDFGIHEDAREAVAFAFLGDRTARGLVGTVPSTTGADRPAILGKISFPSP